MKEKLVALTLTTFLSILSFNVAFAKDTYTCPKLSEFFSHKFNEPATYKYTYPLPENKMMEYYTNDYDPNKYVAVVDLPSKTEVVDKAALQSYLVSASLHAPNRVRTQTYNGGSRVIHVCVLSGKLNKAPHILMKALKNS